MALMSYITQEYVRELFEYRNGNLYWKIYKGSNAKIGDLAGWIDKIRGYRQIRIDGKLCYAHRLIYIYHHRHDVFDEIDHIDGDPRNNRIENLRKATSSQNRMNARKKKANGGKDPSSNFKGVHWNKGEKKWVSQITIDKKTKHLGLFISEIEAARSYNKAALEQNGEFAKINDIGD